MTQAVTISFVTEPAVIAMDVDLSGLRNAIDRTHVPLFPIDVEVLPKCCGSETQHAAVVFLERRERICLICQVTLCREQEIAHECRKSARSILGEEHLFCFAKRSSRKILERHNLLFLDDGHIFSGQFYKNLLGQRTVHPIERFKNAGTLCTKLGKATHALCFVRMPVRRPVNKIPAKIKIAVFRNTSVNLMEQPAEIVLLRKNVGKIPRSTVILLHDHDPPHAVHRIIVHPTRKRRLIFHKIKAVCNTAIVIANRQQRSHFRIKISHPDKTVAFDPIPNIFLRTQLHRTRSSIINTVDEFV